MATKAEVKEPVAMAALLIGAFGGMAPELVKIVPQFLQNRFPTVGFYIALALLAVFGVVAVLISRETDLRKALILGAGAPALIAGLTSAVAAPTSSSAMLDHLPSIVSTALAQPPAAVPMNIALSLERNGSPHDPSKLWIHNGDEAFTYDVQGSTILVHVPAGEKQLTVDYPSAPETQGLSLTLPIPPSAQPVRLEIVSNKIASDFWKTFGGAKVAKYRIQRIK